ncbi:MAG TPA: hypothetical protein VHZ51_24830, partial [Ktedonobacteraceae bacterium]|nr:hypothetical protein [Ktedonobacteraceae bacterium]
MKYLKIGKWGLVALGVIVVACCLRLVLISQNWPMLNSDEGTMGIMARHIAYRGEWPIFFYGQYYMGVFQAYVGALLFHLFGASLFSLRLGLVLMSLGFLGCMYLLTRALYTRPFALFIVCLLAFGSYYMLEYQLHAYGGYSEILICGAVAFLLASNLAITSSPFVSWRLWRWRFLSYVGWGFVVSMGLWSDSLILPLVVTSGLLLLLFCWRELLRLVPPLCILLGLGIGAIPLIIYNLYAAPGQDSFTILWKLQQGGSHSLLQYTLPALVHALKSTTLTSIPMITGNPFCPVSEEVDLHDPTTAHMLKCTLVHATWGGGYLLLFAWAFLLVTWAVWAAYRAARTQSQDMGARRELARLCARYLLLFSGLIALIGYVVSNAPMTWPGVEARYLIGLWLVWPVVLWPLWGLARPAFAQLRLAWRVGKIAAMAVLVCLVVMSMVGSAKVL